jgi:serine phosphatase RsbU (regulator of sigma subunit)
VSLVGLAATLVTGSDPIGYTTVIASLLFNLVVAALDYTGRPYLAAQLFCFWINGGVLLFFGANLFQDGNLAVGVIFACVLAMTVMLAGMLLGSIFAMIYALANSLAIFAILWRYFNLPGVGLENSPLVDTLSTGIPVVAFLIIVAVISWLYQRSLAQSETRLNLARQRIVKDELLRRDLAIARDLQQRLYPSPPMTRQGLQIASRSEPARETSGDFYDYIDLEDGQLGIVVADVTGKSIAAALLMALARGTLRSAARRHSSPAEVLFHANEALCRDQTARQMITAFYGILDTRSLTLRFANAGHPYPLLRRGATIEEAEVSGLPLGAMANTVYSQGEIALQAGDQLYVISDGLVEERNRRRELFGYERLYATISAADPLEPERALDDLWRALLRFRDGTDQDDDITLVVIQAAHAIDSPALPKPMDKLDRQR